MDLSKYQSQYLELIEEYFKKRTLINILEEHILMNVPNEYGVLDVVDTGKIKLELLFSKENK